jgi:hypothetical protein
MIRPDIFAACGLALVIFAIALAAWGRRSLQPPRRRGSHLAVREYRRERAGR